MSPRCVDWLGVFFRLFLAGVGIALAIYGWINFSN